MNCKSAKLVRYALAAATPLLSIACEYGGVSGGPGATVPADPHVAASPAFVIQTTNQGYATFDRSAVKFYSGPYPLPGCGGDARVYYDGTVQRWYMVSQIPETVICLGVSSSWHPFLPWSYWYLTKDGGASPSDYPSLSWSDRHLLITQAKPGGAAWIVDKGQALAGTAVVYTYLQKQDNSYAARMPSNELRNNVFAVEPGGASPPSGLWVKRFEGYVPNLTIRAARIDTQNYGNPPAPTQPAPGPPIDLRSVGTEMLDAMVIGNKIYALMADSYFGHAALRLFRVNGADSANLNLTLESSTLIYLDGNDAFFGSLAAYGGGETWIGGNCSGSNVFLSACLARIPAGSAPATRNMVVVKFGTTVYASGPFPVRWGDYTSIAPDFGNPPWIWFTAQVALHSNINETRTWVMRVHKDCNVTTRECPPPGAAAAGSELEAIDLSGMIAGSPTVDSEIMENGETRSADVGIAYPEVPDGLVLPHGDQ